jgi:hypothetical protein
LKLHIYYVGQGPTYTTAPVGTVERKQRDVSQSVSQSVSRSVNSKPAAKPQLTTQSLPKAGFFSGQNSEQDTLDFFQIKGLVLAFFKFHLFGHFAWMRCRFHADFWWGHFSFFAVCHHDAVLEPPEII